MAPCTGRHLATCGPMDTRSRSRRRRKVPTRGVHLANRNKRGSALDRKQLPLPKEAQDMVVAQAKVWRARCRD
jgi:hypothetical protein